MTASHKHGEPLICAKSAICFARPHTFYLCTCKWKLEAIGNAYYVDTEAQLQFHLEVRKADKLRGSSYNVFS